MGHMMGGAALGGMMASGMGIHHKKHKHHKHHKHSSSSSSSSSSSDDEFKHLPKWQRKQAKKQKV